VISEHNDYLIQVKNSSLPLTKKVKKIVSEQDPISQAETSEINRGRSERRILELYKPEGNDFSEWSNLNAIISVRRIRKTMGSESDCVHYYIASLKTTNAKALLNMVRKHWWVENKLHFVKDVFMEEDRTKFRTYDRYKKNSLYRNVVFNFLKLIGHKSIKEGKETYANNVTKCVKLLRT